MVNALRADESQLHIAGVERHQGREQLEEALQKVYRELQEGGVTARPREITLEAAELAAATNVAAAFAAAGAEASAAGAGCGNTGAAAMAAAAAIVASRRAARAATAIAAMAAAAAAAAAAGTTSSRSNSLSGLASPCRASLNSPARLGALGTASSCSHLESVTLQPFVQLLRCRTNVRTTFLPGEIESSNSPGRHGAGTPNAFNLGSPVSSPVSRSPALAARPAQAPACTATLNCLHLSCQRRWGFSSAGEP